ncbi:MAG: hypothetical protein ACLP8S_03115 [Solirubrobacteraceae bacterium]
MTGLVVALSAIWMTLFYEAQAGTGDLLYMLRLVFASAMAAESAIRRPARYRPALPTSHQQAGALA